MIRTVFFDAAGTLIEPGEPVARVYARYFASEGWQVEESKVNVAFKRVFGTAGLPDYASHPDGDRAERSWWRAVVIETTCQCGVEFSGEAADRCFEGLFRHYARGDAWIVFPEARECLEVLRAGGFRLGVISNFDRRLHGILRDLRISGYFDVILTSADACARKPDPGIFHKALAAMGAEAGVSVHLGDDPKADGDGAGVKGLEVFILDRPKTDLRDALGWIRTKIERK